VPLKVKIT